MSSKNVTIVEVARRARVSAGTVSNALTGKRPVADATRERIMQVIDELGYQPNLVARSLVNRRSKTIGVVASGLEYYGPSRTLVGIEQKANELDYSILLNLLHSPVEDDVEQVLNAVSARRVDGVIWAVHEIGDNRAWLAGERLGVLPPIVFLTMKPREQVSVINTDNRGGARLAVGHLIESRYRSIGHITGPLDWWEARERLQGWQECLHEVGRDASDNLIAQGNWSAASGESGLVHLLANNPDIDAVFAANDQMALGALRAAHRLGRRVPDDLAVVGYDNIPESAYFWPPLTTVRQHLVDLGRVAVEELQNLIVARDSGDGEDIKVVRMLTPELVIRESSGAISNPVKDRH